jgi:hypothetical protein
MAKFFARYPKVVYSLNDATNLDVVTNITTRVKIIDKYLTNSLSYYEYDVQEGDTPEIIAHKFYDDVERHWIVLMANNIIDPMFDWPMNYTNFIKYLDDKYGSLAPAGRTGTDYAKSTIYKYQKIITTTDGYGNINESIINIGDGNALGQITYSNLPTSTTTVSPAPNQSVIYTISKKICYVYDYEDELNESKRKIKLIRKEYIPQIEEELKSLLKA